MKFKFTQAATLKLLVMAAVIICCYTACKKEQTTRTTPNTNGIKVATEIAADLYRSLTGQLGGLNLGNGLKSPYVNAAGRSMALLSTTNPLCGFTTDTSYKSQVLLGDTVRTFSGSFKFTYNCGNEAVNGYSLSASESTRDTSVAFVNTYNSTQNDTVTTLNSTRTLFSLAGKQGLNGSLLSYAGNHAYVNASYEFNNSYTFSGVQFTVTNGVADVTTGTANITWNIVIIGTGPGAGDGTYLFGGGTITFLGNHLAKVQLIGGIAATYTVNMLTGQVVAS